MAETKRNGRPYALEPDEKTLQTIKGLGQIQAVSKECAAVLGVTEATWIAFKKRHAPLIEETYDLGKGEGLASLRRRQFKMAETNASMAIWLGKQYLGQSDKQEMTANVNSNVSVSDARTQLERLIDSTAAAGENKDRPQKPH